MPTADTGFALAVAAVQDVAQECGVRMLLVGAFARDLLLEQWGVGTSLRRTRDVDFGVQVGDWDAFDRLRESLFATGDFAPVEKIPHKVKYQDQVEVDLVPFGGVATEQGRLRCWPDDFRLEMNVLGYQEALDCAVRCPVADLPMVTLPAFVGLKILSWNDGPHRRQKDAKDLAFVLKSLPTTEKVIDAATEWPDEDWDDFDRRCHRWLGSQVGLVFGPLTRNALKDVLTRETSIDDHLRLVRQMSDSYKEPEKARQALEGLRTGLAAASGGGNAS